MSLDAFFQVNTAGAEMLYRTVGELRGVNSNTILLDVCCGTGGSPWQNLHAAYIPNTIHPAPRALADWEVVVVV